MKRFIISVAFLSVASACYAVNKFVPPDKKILLIVGQDVDNIRGFREAVPVVPAGYSAYTSAEFAEGLETADDNRGGIQYAQSLVDQYPGAVILLAIYMVDMEEKVYSGEVDQSLGRIGNWIKAARRPVYLRIGYEFDYPENGYEPQKYIRAYRYIVDRFRQTGVDNVAYVWHSYASEVKRPHLDWYPGDDYVDWFAISYFDQSHEMMNEFVRLAKERNKPLMIAEASPWFLSTSQSDEAWNKWFVPFFSFIRKNDVKAVSYINCDWDRIPLFESKSWGDARIQSNELIKKKWLAEIGQDRYLKASPDLYRQLGFEQ